MAVPKQKDRVRHFRKVQQYQKLFGRKEQEPVKEETEEEKKAKEDKILALFGKK